MAAWLSYCSRVAFKHGPVLRTACMMGTLLMCTMRHPARPCTPPQPQDFLNRCNLPMEEMARSVPPTVCMLCLHGTADTTIPFAVRASGLTAKAAMGVVDCSAAGQAANGIFFSLRSCAVVVCKQLITPFSNA